MFESYSEQSLIGLDSGVQLLIMMFSDILMSSISYPDDERFANLKTLDMSKNTTIEENKTMTAETTCTQKPVLQ